MEPGSSSNEMTYVYLDQRFVGFDSFLLLLTFAGIIFGFFYLVRNYLFPLIESEKMIARAKILSFRIEVLFWLGFTLFTLTFLLVRNPLIVSILLAVVAAVGFSFWRDFFPGLFFRLSQSYKVEDTVVFSDIKGQIEKLGWTSVQLRTDRDALVFVPYRRISDQIHTKQQAKGKLLSAKIVLPIGDMDNDLMHSKIEKWLMNCPWAVPQQQLIVNRIETDKIAVTVYAIDQLSLSKIEDYLLTKVFN